MEIRYVENNDKEFDDSDEDYDLSNVILDSEDLDDNE